MSKHHLAASRHNRDPVDWTHCSALQIHHAECEVNFLRLQKLLPGFASGQACRIGAQPIGAYQDVLEVLVTERCPYTAELRVRQKRPVWGRRSSEFRVRVYLDARMAEVVGCENVRRLLPRYDYPNARGLARDEKWQHNRLLGEWLSRCLSDGHALSDAALAVGG
jgi:uncharacterized protein YqiB (DUF1249 family)